MLATLYLEKINIELTCADFGVVTCADLSVMLTAADFGVLN